MIERDSHNQRRHILNLSSGITVSMVLDEASGNVYDEAGNEIKTHEPRRLAQGVAAQGSRRIGGLGSPKAGKP